MSGGRILELGCGCLEIGDRDQGMVELERYDSSSTTSVA
jgi:hypothetical protein